MRKQWNQTTGLYRLDKSCIAFARRSLSRKAKRRMNPAKSHLALRPSAQRPACRTRAREFEAPRHSRQSSGRRILRLRSGAIATALRRGVAHVDCDRSAAAGFLPLTVTCDRNVLAAPILAARDVPVPCFKYDCGRQYDATSPHHHAIDRLRLRRPVLKVVSDSHTRDSGVSAVRGDHAHAPCGAEGSRDVARDGRDDDRLPASRH